MRGQRAISLRHAYGGVSSGVIVRREFRALVLLKGDVVFENIPKDGNNRCSDMAPFGSGMQALVAKYMVLLALALAAPASLAQDVAPDALLRAVTVKVIDKINEDQGLRAADPAKVAFLVQTMVLPLFDFVHMTQLATARNWRLATPEQQRVLTEEFKTLLIRTYSTALANYRGEVIDFKRVRAAPPNTQVTVRSEVTQPGRERMTLDYEMENTPAGWKIYDVKVAGVRLVTTYRDVFAEKVRDGGVDGLIKFLVDGNRGGGSRFNTVKNSFWEKSQIMYAIFQNMVQSGRQ
jgi:phospholipid transport system substrate-binding protein